MNPLTAKRSILVLSIALCAACSSQQADSRAAVQVPPPLFVAEDAPPGVHVGIGRIAAPEKLAVFSQMGGEERLRDTLEAMLRSQGKLQRLRSVVVEVISFRLRSDGAIIAIGVMSGADSMEVQVHVVDDSGGVRSFKTGAASVGFGAYAGPSDHRFDKVLTAVAERVSAQI